MPESEEVKVTLTVTIKIKGPYCDPLCQFFASLFCGLYTKCLQREKLDLENEWDFIERCQECKISTTEGMEIKH